MNGALAEVGAEQIEGVSAEPVVDDLGVDGTESGGELDDEEEECLSSSVGVAWLMQS